MYKFVSVTPKQINSSYTPNYMNVIFKFIYRIFYKKNKIINNKSIIQCISLFCSFLSTSFIKVKGRLSTRYHFLLEYFFNCFHSIFAKENSSAKSMN